MSQQPSADSLSLSSWQGFSGESLQSKCNDLTHTEDFLRTYHHQPDVAESLGDGKMRGVIHSPDGERTVQSQFCLYTQQVERVGGVLIFSLLREPVLCMGTRGRGLPRSACVPCTLPTEGGKHRAGTWWPWVPAGALTFHLNVSWDQLFPLPKSNCSSQRPLGSGNNKARCDLLDERKYENYFIVERIAKSCSSC